MSDCDTGRGNQILASLDPDEYRRVQPWLEAIVLERGQVLTEAGRKLGHVYFPTTAVVSLVRLTNDGNTAEIAWTGREGVVGLPLLLGREHMDTRAVTQAGGAAVRIDVGKVKSEFDRGKTLQAAILSYAVTLMSDMAQAATCNRHHRLVQQLSRWLLHSVDRCETSQLRSTQEEIASLIGVRREAITVSIRKLQASGLLRCSRGRIEVLDRVGLERIACECYVVLSSERRRWSQPAPQNRVFRKLFSCGPEARVRPGPA